MERCKNRNTEEILVKNRRGTSESEPNTESVEPNGGELENIVSKILGSSLCEDVNDWLNYDRDDPGHHIMTRFWTI
jgi:hypothetical protein